MASDGVYSRLFYCSSEANATGIKFYEGQHHLEPLRQVILRRDRNNVHDKNAIEVLLQLRTAQAPDGKKIVKLGHLERRVAPAVTKLLNNLRIIVRG